MEVLQRDVSSFAKRLLATIRRRLFRNRKNGTRAHQGSSYALRASCSHDHYRSRTGRFIIPAAETECPAAFNWEVWRVAE